MNMGLRLVLILSLLGASIARAELSKSTKTMMKAGGYGAVGGAVLGLASYPAHRSLRGAAMATSIGLYLGLAAGAYAIYNPESMPAFVENEVAPELPQPQIVVKVLDF